MFFVCYREEYNEDKTIKRFVGKPTMNADRRKGGSESGEGTHQKPYIRKLCTLQIELV